jgi:hypoxanthine phosphoribosyltransferase/broad specificity phosphatase PhoE
VRELTWNDFAHLAGQLAEKLEPFQPQAIVGIARAGLFPATAVACSLRRELFPARLTRRLNDEVIYTHPVWKVPLSPEIAGKTVAIVDEIADSGQTLAIVADQAHLMGASQVITASLVSHSWVNPAPDITALITDEFIIFPWDRRVRLNGEWVPHPEIVAGLAAQSQPASGGAALRILEVRRHTMRDVPNQHLTQDGVELARRVGAEIGPFDRVITSTIPRTFETALAMGFAVDEQNEALNALREDVEEEVHWDAGFAAFARAVQKGGAAGRYAQAQAELWRSIAAALPEAGCALLITHGGIIEAGAVACLPAADHAAWGRFCDYCEGMRLYFDGQSFTMAEILRRPT